MRSLLTMARFEVTGEASHASARPALLSRGQAVLALAALTVAVAADRLSVPLGNTNYRVELIVGGLLAAWLLFRGRGEVLRRVGAVEIGLAGWWAANLVSSAIFSPFPEETVKYSFIIAGVLAIYFSTKMLLSSHQAVASAAFVWIAVGAGVALLALVSALLYSIFGLTWGVFLERTLRDDVFTITPQVQSVIWEPNILGSYSLTIIALAFVISLNPLVSGRRQQLFLALAVGVACCATMLSMTRTAWALFAALVIALMVVALVLRLATLRQVLRQLLVPVSVGAMIGLLVGLQFMPTLSWHSKLPWDLSYAQVEQVAHNVILGGSPPSDETIESLPLGSDALPAASGPPVQVSKGSALADKAREADAPAIVPSLGLRAGVVNTALQDWLQRPILGWGTGAFQYLHPPVPGGAFWIANLEAHALFDSGAIGLLSLLAAFGVAVWRAVLALRSPVRSWGTTHYVLLGLLAGGAALIGAYQMTEGTWLGFTWVFFATLVAASNLTTSHNQAA